MMFDFQDFLRDYEQNDSPKYRRSLRIRYVPLMSQVQLLYFYETFIKPYETPELIYELEKDVQGAYAFKEALLEDIRQTRLLIQYVDEHIYQASSQADALQQPEYSPSSSQLE